MLGCRLPFLVFFALAPGFVLSAPRPGLPKAADAPSHSCDAPFVLPDRAQMENKVREYLLLSEQALAMRAVAIRLYNDLQARRRQGIPLRGEDLLVIQQGAADLLAQRDVLLALALEHECWTHRPPEAGEAGDIQRAGVLISLSAALTLYDNYLSAISLFRDDIRLRQLVNRGDKGFDVPANALLRVDQMFASSKNRRRVRRAIQWRRQYAQVENSPFEGYAYLLRSIDQSLFYYLVQQRRNPLSVLGSAFRMAGNVAVDVLSGLGKEGAYVSSFLFGNAAGLVETRRGKLERRPDVLEKAGGLLRAGDILLEKTPFRLTDTFIPGHWGHAAVWVGGEEELKALGIWDDPLLLPRQAEIRAGKSVAEALRSGVEMNTLAHFMNIDDLAILRQPALSDDRRREIILQTLRQVGKEYDFNFDAESTDRIFCSKLIYLVYGDIAWPTSRLLGRFTVSPDDIARRALGDAALDIVLLYHDGELTDAPYADMAKFLGGQERQKAGDERREKK